MDYKALPDKALLAEVVKRLGKKAIAEHFGVNLNQLSVWSTRGFAKHVRPRLELMLRESEVVRASDVMGELVKIRELLERVLTDERKQPG